MDAMEYRLGVRPIFGGYHKTFGTKNALVNLNNQMYLELLAADDSNSEIAPPRWMGVDLRTKNQITRWALKSDALKTDTVVLKKYNPQMVEIRKGSRHTADGSLLEWELLMPLASPEVELVPFLLNWGNSVKHPSAILPNMGCELIALYGTHPNPEVFTTTFEALGYGVAIKQSNEVALKALIKSPNGMVEI